LNVEIRVRVIFMVGMLNDSQIIDYRIEIYSRTRFSIIDS